ncbi:hypothetical protein LMH87_001903 [Akanthomyces muscarius]|uniref:Uncharacterized protein n=1 Tax=Akanthomyces muscarius TaxID=2231603 RepID=A0A9W8UGL0_AKAMU|nr:hypothetical protein LMH87_001903 [Akanthomyces muscarius]KAJ4147381.1 hypothetical protein LMH87_001903 [Akanthomyces muscarius]
MGLFDNVTVYEVPVALKLGRLQPRRGQMARRCRHHQLGETLKRLGSPVNRIAGLVLRATHISFAFRGHLS